MEVRKIKVADIKVGTRIRKDMGDVKQMADSLARHGQLQPIIVTDDNRLIAGGRRLEGVKLLGQEYIDAVYLQDIDPASALEKELEENLCRKELNWIEEVLALEGIVKLRQSQFGKPGDVEDRLEGKAGYSLDDAVKELERSKGSISMDLALARGLREYPELLNEKSKVSAFKRYRNLKDTAIRTAKAKLARDSLDPAELTADQPEAKPLSPTEDVPSGPIRIPIRKVRWPGKGILYHADCRDVARLYPDHSVDLIVTDPPFGLGMYKEGDKIGGGRLAENVGDMYDDDPHAVMDMLDEAFMHLARILKENAHAYIFFHHTRYEPIYLMLKKHFGTCEETPIVWIKNTPGIGDPNRTWVYAYEPFFFVNRGRPLVKAQAFNYLKYDTVPPGKKIHGTEKPVALMRHIIQASAVPGEVVMDPFAGSGSTLVAAHQLGCKFIGCERKETIVSKTIERLADALAEEATPGETGREEVQQEVEAELS